MLVRVGDKLTVANCGDSRAILVKKDGEFKPLSIDHKPDRPDERERITKAGGEIVWWKGWRVDGQIAMSRALGDISYKECLIPDPECFGHRVKVEDFCVILATDGLWDVVDNQEVASMVAEHQHTQTLQGIADVLLEEAVKRQTMDNCTLIVVGL